MPITYKNRTGDIYYLKQKESKTGKPRYFFSKNIGGNLPSKIPDGFEIYEHPNAQVFLRKKLVSKIKPEEIDLCKNRFDKICQFNEKALIVDYKQNEIIIHFSEQIAYLPPIPEEQYRSKKDIDKLVVALFSNAIYLPMLKFILVDEDNRLFITERFCFLGGIDDWMEIGSADKLTHLIDTYGKHLGEESFFDLI